MSEVPSTVEINCLGRDPKGKPVLPEPILVPLRTRTIHDNPEYFSIHPARCVFAGGKDAQFCTAVSSDQQARCPYNFEAPYARTLDPSWRPPEDLLPFARKHEVQPLLTLFSAA